MSDLVGNPEDRFSHVEAQMVCVHYHENTYTQYIEAIKIEKIKSVDKLLFFLILLKTLIVGKRYMAEAVLVSTHNLLILDQT